MTTLDLPAETIKTRDAAEAILRLYDTFDLGSEPDDWVEEIKEKWPDLAAALFTAIRDE